jgi:hypothetical protein
VGRSAGGATSTSGATSKGGATSTGGVMGTGGVGTGGVASTGGSSGTGGVAAAGGTGTSGLFLDGFFLIGTFMPTIYEFGKWHDRGVNTGVGLNSYTDPSTGRTLQVAIQDWDSQAKAQGMRTIRNPMPNPADDLGNTTLLAWDQMDEQPTLTNAAITLTGVDTATSASVFNESRTVTLANGKLTDTFGAFAVHIYVVAK